MAHTAAFFAGGLVDTTIVDLADKLVRLDLERFKIFKELMRVDLERNRIATRLTVEYLRADRNRTQALLPCD